MGSIIYLILVGVLYTSGVVTEVQAAILFVVIMVLKISIKVSYICEALTEISNKLGVIDSNISLTRVINDNRVSSSRLKKEGTSRMGEVQQKDSVQE